jgi:stage IV sporulation protein FB
MSWSLSLGSIVGVRIRIHLTFLIFLAWIGLAFWHSGGGEAAARGIAYILLLFGCVVLHEFGHILTAKRFGAKTVDVILLPIGGLARMQGIPEKPREELLVALAGPFTNLIIASVLIAFIGPHALSFGLGRSLADLSILPSLAVANLFLALFNLVPAFPMDGGRVLRALLTYSVGRDMATTMAARIGHYLAVGLGVFGFLGGLPLLMLVAVFIYFGASAEYNHAQMRSFARGLVVSDVMMDQFSVLPVTKAIGDAVAVLVHSAQHDIPLVDGVGKPVAILTRNEIVQALHQHGQYFPVAEAARTGMTTVLANAALEEALQLMEEGAPAVAVVDVHGRLKGMLTLESLGQWMMLRRMNPEAA